jgi:hypothetical protein
MISMLRLQACPKDFNDVIEMEPSWPETYYGRAFTLKELGMDVATGADFAKYQELTGQQAP